MIEKVNKSEEEWKEQLPEASFRILREGGTEAPYSGKYWDEKAEGIYYCGACHLELFDSTTKYDSGTGWPSFTALIRPELAELKTDSSHNMIRTEVNCARCGSHLGHVFPDGPNPTGMRFCINSLSLEFERGTSK
ncbi:MAG: peptide-methionine (R)-S-oxide reductase MsrB [Bacteroidia bacterium]|nr:peptide-methionine (R)-S-oxide reductase MsrB [Bacteroidia bacterium]